MRDAEGGEASQMLGIQFGATASVLTYSWLRNSPAAFTLYPFTPAKTPGYARLGGAFLLFYLFGTGYVTK
jgi:hypothetical protein